MSNSFGDQAVTCAHCGSVCEEGARFCPFCGSPIGTDKPGEDVLVGETVGGVVLGERLRVDAFGRIFRGKTSDGREVHARVFHRHWERKRSFFSRAVDVLSPWLGWRHPYARTVLDVSVDEQRHHLVSVERPWEARCMSEMLARHGRLPFSRVQVLGTQLLDVMQAVHEAERCHGGIVPSCIYFGLDDEGQMVARLGGFGIARLAYEAAPRLWTEGADLGSALFQSPEAAGGGHALPSDDLFSVAAVLFYALTGRPTLPYGASLAVERLLRAGQASLACTEVQGPLSAVLDVLATAMDASLQNRFESAEAFQHAWSQACDRVSKAGSGTNELRAKRRPRLYGLDQQLASLREVAASPISYGRGSQGKPRGAAAIVTGNAGTGKTALLSALLSSLTGGALAVWRVNGLGSSVTSLGPFVNLARGVLAVYPGTSPEVVDEVERHLRERFDMSEDDIQRLLDLVTERPSSLRLDPASLRREQVVALRLFVGRIMAERPSVLIVDNLDVMDAASRRLVEDLIGASASMPFSVVVASRIEPWPDWKARHVRRIRLGRLSDVDAARLVEGVGESELRERALSWAGGNALRLVTFAQAVRQMKATSDASREFRRGGDLKFGQLVASVVNGLESALADILIRCATAGARVPLALAAGWMGESIERRDLCRVLGELGWIQCADTHLFFVSEGIREVLVSLLSPSQRKSIHRQVADWYAGQAPKQGGRERVAIHLDLAGQTQQAASLFDAEGARWLVMREHEEAAQFFEMAWTRWEQLGQRQPALSSFFGRLQALVEGNDAARISPILNAIPDTDEPAYQAIHARALAAVSLASGDLQGAVSGLRRSMDQLASDLPSSAMHDLKVDYAVSALKAGDLAGASSAASKALDIAMSQAHSRTGDVRLIGDRIARDASRLADILERQGKLDLARVMLMAAYDQTHRLPDPSASGRILAVMGHLSARSGDMDRAIEQCSRALALTRKAGNRFAAARVLLNMGTYQVSLGQRREAARLFQDAAGLARQAGWSRGVRLAAQALRQVES